jgi:phage head maturation protease
MQKFQKFIKITKVDEEQRMVYGFASTPDLDSDGEIIKLEAIEKSLSSYMEFPTIREMHQAKAIGKTVSAEIRTKGQKGLYIGAKIVADDAWKLVKENIYKAFSIGGNVVRRVNNVIEELDLIEISLVDVPANKAAVIELWKRATDVKKSAYDVYDLSNIMIQIKDMISYFEFIGKPTKDLEKCLEQIKGVIAVEAQESEKDAQARMEAMWEDSIFMGQTFDAISQIVKGMTFNDPKANLIREGVITAMDKKAEELKKAADAKRIEDEAKAIVKGAEDAAQETATETETPASTEETPATTTETTEVPATTTEVADKVEGEETETTEDEDKETSAAVTLTKLAEVNEDLDKVSSVKKTEKLEEIELTKAVHEIAGTLAKMTNIIKAQNDRIALLEKQPAAVKSKAAFVFKSEEDKNKITEEAAKKTESPVLATKKARLAELEKFFDEKGAYEFSQKGYSTEASALQNEIAELERAAK